MTTDKDLAGLARAPSRGAVGVTDVPMPAFHWRSRLVLPGVIGILTLALLAYGARDLLWAATPVRVVPVIVKDGQTAEPGAVVVQAPGWVEADPFPVAVSALADGVVSEVLVLEGQRVEQGQIVARLVDDDARIAVEHAAAMLAQRHAALAVAQAKFAEAQRNWEHPVELIRLLHTAEARLAEKSAELQRWPHEMAREEARAVYLEMEFKRVEPLATRGSAASIEVVRAKQDLLAQQAQIEVVRKLEDILKAHLRELQAEVDAARENLELRIPDTRALDESRAGVQLAEAAVASATAMRDDAALRFERMAVRSPAAGVVMMRLAEPGSKVMLSMDDPQSAQIVRLYDPQKLQVRVDIPLVEAAKVGVGQPAEVIVDVLPDRVYQGRLSRIVHQADVQKNTLQVKVAIEDPTAELKPEMLARARFLGSADQGTASQDGAAAQRVYAPRSAVFDRDGTSCVWVADQTTRTARLQAVTVGRGSVDDWVVILDGVQGGDRVIPNPDPALRPGQRIELIEDE